MKLQLILLEDLFYRGTWERGPKGDKEDIGSQGLATLTEIISYVERYLANEQELQLSADVDSIVSLNETGLDLFAEYTSENAMDIKENWKDDLEK